jgi:hypothetical protein
LRLKYDIFFTYPGARGEANKPIEVEYEVRPYTNQIMWNPSGYVPDAVNTIAVVTPAAQDFSTGKGKITITPLNEGSFELIGTMSGKIARLTVIIQNAYRLSVSKGKIPCLPTIPL